MARTAKTSQEVARENGAIDIDDVDAPDAPALVNYEARDDVETLENRRAREVSADFETAHAASANATGVITSEVPKRK